MIKVDKDDLERRSAYITRDITLQKATAGMPEETPVRQEPVLQKKPRPLKTSWKLSVPELQQDRRQGYSALSQRKNQVVAGWINLPEPSS